MTGTIQGSVRIPPDEIGKRFGELPRDKAIIAYCTRQEEFTSARVVSFLEKQGYRAFARKGGYHSPAQITPRGELREFFTVYSRNSHLRGIRVKSLATLHKS